MTDPGVTGWGSDDPGVINTWEEWGDTAGWADVCPDGSQPLIIERDGQQFPSCLSTGIFYAPPFAAPALAELLWPDEWSLLPPG